MAIENRTVLDLLGRHGLTLAEELELDLCPADPSDLFRLLCAAVLRSEPIDGALAVRAARGLAENGWTSAGRLAGSEWAERVDVLRSAGVIHRPEAVAMILEELARGVRDRWDGDLRQLREEADRDPSTERLLLRQVRGVGEVGLDTFFREIQLDWEEVAPFAGEPTLAVARRLGLPDDAERLRRLTGDPVAFVRLLAALGEEAPPSQGPPGGPLT